MLLNLTAENFHYRITILNHVLGDLLKKALFFLFTLMIGILLTLESAFSQETNEVLKQLEYPELVVTPLASQRLREEAAKEKSGNWSHWLPIQISAAMTLAAGMSADGDYDKGLVRDSEIKKNKDQVDNSSQFAFVVGAGWLISSTFFSITYTPYTKGFNETKDAIIKTKKQKLAKERSAEEHIHHAGSFSKKIKYLAIASNILANAYVLSEAQEDSQITAAFGILGAFIPVIFPLHWETISDTHNSYKKKIYGPISQLVPTSNGYIPTLGLAMSF